MSSKSKVEFADLGLSPFLLKAIEQENYQAPFPIQEKAIPAILAKKDVLGIAKTGSGKTASYVLPILMNLKEEKNTKNRHISTLILVPTRELAVQIEHVIHQFITTLPYSIKSYVVHGGVSINPQMKGLQNVNILVATTGRLLELIESNAVHLSSVSTLVLDEADKMLNLGFKKEMDRIFNLLPKNRQNLLFSATLSPVVQNIERVLLKNPLVIQIAAETENLDSINQLGYFVSSENKGPLLRHLIVAKEMKQVLVFTSSTYQANLVTDKLINNGIKAKAIHSKKSQGHRTEVLKEFKKGDITVLVATDLLSRGIDIEFLPYVINYELPRSPKDFIHRIGRTGRADKPGQAITFVTAEDKHHFRVIQKKMKKWLTMIDSENIDL